MNDRACSRKVVLVVDDDPDWIRFAVAVLGEDYRVESAADSEEALRRAVRHAPDVVILDVMMPGSRDGFTAFCELKRHPETRAVPVIILSQVNDATKLAFGADNVERYLGKRPVAFLEKPISPDQLRAVVAGAVASAGP